MNTCILIINFLERDCNEPHSGRRQALDDKGLQATINEDSSPTSGENVRQFKVSDEIIRPHLHRLGKTHR